MKQTIKDMEGFALTSRLNQIVTEGYKRRSRQLPNNVAEIVDYLKTDLLRYMPGVTLETIDDAVTFEVLHDDKTPISPTFFFSAVRKHYQPPTEARDMDKDELWQWKERLRYLESKGLGNSPKADECRQRIADYTNGDDEGQTIRLLDICAGWVAKSDEAKQAFTVKTSAGIILELPAFNSRREFAYLVMRKQLAEESLTHFFDKAIQDVNEERLASRHHRIDRDAARKDPDVMARQKRLAVIDWLRACNTMGRKPSDILTPLMNETQYQQLRTTV